MKRGTFWEALFSISSSDPALQLGNRMSGLDRDRSKARHALGAQAALERITRYLVMRKMLHSFGPLSAMYSAWVSFPVPCFR